MNARRSKYSPFVKGFVFVFASAIIASVGFIVFPGCGLGPAEAPQLPYRLPPRTSVERSYDSARDALERMKRRGELPGLEPGAPGTFIGRWVRPPWEASESAGPPQIHFIFYDPEMRPLKEFDVALTHGWQLVSRAR
jgi:hypothetical protein